MSVYTKKRIPKKKYSKTQNPANLSAASLMAMDDMRRDVRRYRHAVKVQKDQHRKSTKPDAV